MAYADDQLKVVGKGEREGDEIPADHLLVIRVLMHPSGWAIDLDANFAEMLESFPGRIERGEAVIEAVTKSVRMHTGKGMVV